MVDKSVIYYFYNILILQYHGMKYNLDSYFRTTLSFLFNV